MGAVAHTTIDIDSIRTQALEYSSIFLSAGPIRHVVIDDAILPGPESISSFPLPEWERWHYEGDAYQVNKFTSSDAENAPEPWKSALYELISPSFLPILETITGIPKLLIDPYFEGGGLHLSSENGILGLHTDFHVYKRLDLYRRVNIIVYLNPDWSEGDGGELTIQSARHPERGSKVIEPQWGRMVIFQTDDDSVHGFTNPVAPGKVRRSLATYYYTAIPTSNFSGDSTTHWREHGTFHGMARVRFLTSRLLMHVSRAFSLASHLSNPNQGTKWWKSRSRRASHDRSDPKQTNR
jgi:hypothetical protein